MLLIRERERPMTATLKLNPVNFCFQKPPAHRELILQENICICMKHNFTVYLTQREGKLSAASIGHGRGSREESPNAAANDGIDD